MPDDDEEMDTNDVDEGNIQALPKKAAGNIYSLQEYVDAGYADD